MIEARPSRWAKAIFHIYLMRLFKKHFHAFHLLNNLPETDPELPLLLLPNHSTWWDGFFIYHLNEKHFKRPAYLMMLERQLSRYRFFARVGAYSVDPQHPKSIFISLKYTISLMQKHQHPAAALICIFPQGELQSWGNRPLRFKRGVDWILKRYRAPVNMLPLAMRIEYLGEQRPDVFFLFGENYRTDYHDFKGMTWLEKIELILLEKMNQRIINGEHGERLLTGTRSVNVRWDTLLKKNNPQ